MSEELKEKELAKVNGGAEDELVSCTPYENREGQVFDVVANDTNIPSLNNNDKKK